MENLLLLPDFRDVHLLVVGDVMIDRYLTGSIHRISPEAPVPVLEFQNEENRLGGAANVALNLISMGAQVTLLSVTGDDKEAVLLSDLLKKSGIRNIEIIKCENRKTTLKTRVMAKNQHLLRIDNEDLHDISPDETNNVKDRLVKILNSSSINGIILQDYNKGLLTKELIQFVMQQSQIKDLPTFVDPKEKNFLEFKDCTVFKPNKKEVSKAFNKSTISMDDLIELDKLIREQMNSEINFITLSKDGIFISDSKNPEIIATRSRNIADVCGAGDTVLSILALCYIKKVPIDQIAFLANIAGGQVCEKPGVVPVNLSELRNELSGYY